MITIKKDGDVITCSNGTYESMFKRLGYEIINSSKKVEQPKEKIQKQTKVVENKIPVIEMEKTTEKTLKNKSNKK